jgi:hypothetical protein
MAEALRPMSTGELLDRTFTLYKRNFALFASIIVPAPAIMLAIQLYQLVSTRNILAVAGNQGATPSIAPQAVMANLNHLIWGSAVGVVAWVVGMSITHAATVRAVSAVHLSRPITVGQSYSGLKGKFLRVILIVICLLLAIFASAVVIMIAVALVVALATAGGAAAGVLGKVVGVVIDAVAVVGALIGLALIGARYSLGVQACVVEGTKVFGSMRRSAALAKGSLWRILLIYFLFIVLNMVIAFTLGSAAGLLTAPLHSLQTTRFLGALAGFVAGVLTGPLATIAMSLVYYDERVRKEAFDLQLMMAVLDGPQANAAASAT